MRVFNKAAIIGTGLIGGSVALAIKKKGLAKKIVGVSRHAQSIALAKKLGAIDEGSRELGIVRDSDLVIFATPIDTILRLAPKVARLVKKDCLVTDVGSTKAKIVKNLEKNFKCFVGSHPLAGSEMRGIANAVPDLFNDTLCILTQTTHTDKNALLAVKAFWKEIGATAAVTTPEEHDKALAFTSHLPHLAAFSLMSVIPQGYLKFSASGLKDTTRVASSDSEIWSDIVLSNRKSVLKALADFRGSLTLIEKAVKEGNRRYLRAFFNSAKRKRSLLTKKE